MEMKEYNLTTEAYKAHNDLEKQERDEMVYKTFVGLVVGHRRGIYANDMKIRLSFYDGDVMRQCLEQMECEGVLSLMRHEMGTTRILCIELKQADWGLFRK